MNRLEYGRLHWSKKAEFICGALHFWCFLKQRYGAEFDAFAKVSCSRPDQSARFVSSLCEVPDLSSIDARTSSVEKFAEIKTAFDIWKKARDKARDPGWVP